MRYFLFRDGLIIGTSIDEATALRMLLGQLCRTPGTYAIMTMTDEDFQSRGDFDYRDADNLRMTYDSTSYLLEASQSLWTPEEIDAWHKRQPGSKKYEPKVRHFYMDWFNKTVEGYCQGQRWNGWSCPYFTKAQINALMPMVNTEEYGMYLHWAEDKEGNPILRNLLDPSSTGSEKEEWSATFIQGVNEPVWPVGAFCWVWSSEDHPHIETENGWVRMDSAPELLDALENLLPYLEERSQPGDRWAVLCAREAIAKAKAKGGK
tara:strand:+ start:152 stop:940 length:789 start_codon:yes stop_codon:yes gene_type:complete